MAYSYSERMHGSSFRGTRPTRTSYTPSELINERFSGFMNNDRFRNPAESYPSAPRSDTYAGRTNSRGRGRARGGGGGPARGGRGSSFFHREFDNPNSNPYQSTTRVDSDPFHVAEKLNDLNVNDDKSNAGDGINFDAYEDIPVETTGSNIPPPVNSFDEIDFAKSLNDNIKRCKYVKPTPVQRHSIPISLAGRDLMACAQTGSGKTAAFCLPIISGILKNQLPRARNARVAQPLALVLSPTRELSIQIYDEAKKFSHETGVKIGVAYGGVRIIQQLRDLEKGVDILVATPGRLVDMIERARVSLRMIKHLALDEADRMLDMGFEPQIRKIVEQMDMPGPNHRQTMLFSATFPDEIQRLAVDFLSDYIFLSVGRVGSSTELIAQRVDFLSDTDKRNHLMDILCAQSKLALTLVFVETKRGADSLEQWLCYNGFPATAIHGDKMQPERERSLKSFKYGSTPIMVATDVAARGLDVPNVAHVINYDLPKDIDDYVHRIGRTGRAGKSGIATAFFTDKNAPLAKPLADLMLEANQEVPPWLTQYAERANSSFLSRVSRRYGGGNRFGGRDFRNNAPLRQMDDSYSLARNSYVPASDSYSPARNSYPPVGDSYSPARNSYAPASETYGNMNDSFAPANDSCSPANNSYAPARNSYGDNHDSYAPASDSYSQLGYQSVVATGWE